MYVIIFDESKIKLKNKKKIWNGEKPLQKNRKKKKKTLFKQSYNIILKFQ